MSFGLLTVILVVVTVLTSLAGFNDDRLVNRLILWPNRMKSPNESVRLLSSGFIHADGMHLFFNMFTLFFIGSGVEQAYESRVAWLLYLVLYLAGIAASSLPSFLKNRENPYYRSLGASGGVAAVLFASVYFSPWETIYIFSTIPLPSVLLAGIYLAYAAYMSRRGGSSVNHNAHFWGAIFGFLFTLAVDPNHGRTFFVQIASPKF